MLAAEPVVAGAAAVDVTALGAVERAVKVPHDVEVTSVEQSRVSHNISCLRHLPHLGFFYTLETWPGLTVDSLGRIDVSPL